MNECKEMAYVFRNATDNSLVLVDEFARSTDPLEGAAICCAVAESLLARKCFCLFSSHFFEMYQICKQNPGRSRHYTLTSLEHQSSVVSFSYKAIEVKDNNLETIINYGIKICKVLGFPKKIVETALGIWKSMSPGPLLSPQTQKAELYRRLMTLKFAQPMTGTSD